MLSRSAENLYWMARYIERAGATARLIEMGRCMAMLPRSYSQEEWRSVAMAAGASDLFRDEPVIDEAAIVRLLMLDKDNPSSIRACLERARACGRAERTALTRDLWEALNEGWRTLESTDAVAAQRDLAGLLDWVKQRATL
ncbi:MAG TPA: alpha-E domain-containing protein, partial [Thermohalobaculum sp.]|nr:alpha-E domain-containing protein [Thermohalobaculum sp.]